MTKIFTIGVNKKSPIKFFELLQNNNIDLVIDIRLNNKSQLAGFAKGGDDYLGYLLKEICGINYIHDTVYSPTDEILDNYHRDNNWNKYVNKFNTLIIERNFKKHFDNNYSKYNNVCFLCAEETAEQCHRRLVAESITTNKEEIIHL
jgi:uncharacterized protein (DUF488 family)